MKNNKQFLISESVVIEHFKIHILGFFVSYFKCWKIFKLQYQVGNISFIMRSLLLHYLKDFYYAAGYNMVDMFIIKALVFLILNYPELNLQDKIYYISL